MPAIETAPEVASGNSSEFADPETDEASPATPELAEQAEAASHPAGLAMPTSLSERGNAAPTLEAETGSLTTTGRAQTGSPSGPALPEIETSLQAALGAASETLTRGKPDSGGTSPHSVVPSTEPSPEPGPGPSHAGVRPEGLSSQALTQAADAAQDRGIQTALLATSSPDAAADSTRASPHAAPAVEKPHPVTPPMPLGAVAIEIGLKSLAGLNRFEIRLDPAELGRIDVQLEIGDDGEVKAHLTVDRVETLALLQRDARTLERAFEQAGLKPSEGGIDLTLRDQAGDPEGRGSRDGRRDDSVATPGHDGTDQRAEGQNAAAAASRPLHWRNGIDVRV
jgi:flagellar hook-length control protein FliK